MPVPILSRPTPSTRLRSLWLITRWNRLSREINVEAARLAREACDEITAQTPDRPRYVAGVLGPTNRTCSISPDVNDPASFRNVSFNDLVEAYTESIDGLIEGGSDIILIETIFDTLNAKAAIYAVETYFEDNDIRLPVMISGTITDASGRTLVRSNNRSILELCSPR